MASQRGRSMMVFTPPPQPLRSPMPSSPSSSSSASDMLDDLDSFVMVPSDDEADDTGSTASTVNTALLDLFSDSSAPGSLQGSVHGSLSEVDDLGDNDSDHGLDGSYTDAEATASLITNSRATLEGSDGTDDGHTVPLSTPMPRPSLATAAKTGSELLFIFPALEASIASSGTYTDGHTPSASVSHLPNIPFVHLPTSNTPDQPSGPTSAIAEDKPFARLAGESRSKREKSPIRGVDEGWLKDARTWAPKDARSWVPTHPPPVIMEMPSWEKGQYDFSLASSIHEVEKVEEVKRNIAGGEKEVDAKLLFFPIDERQLQLKRALRAIVVAGAGHAGNRWGLLAFASCALAILGAFGPGLSYLSRETKNDLPSWPYNVSTDSSNSVSPAACVGLDEVFTSTETISATSSTAHTPRSLATQLIPDFQSIRDAISTFTSGPKQKTPDVDSKVETDQREIGRIFDWRKRKDAESADKSVVALTVPYKGEISVVDDTSYKAWIRAMANKVVGPTSPIIPPPLPSFSPACTHTPSPSAYSNRYDYLIQRTRDYAMSTTSAIAQLYYPMMLHLEYELQELSRLTSYIAERNLTKATMANLRIARHTAKDLGRQLVRASERQRISQINRINRLLGCASGLWTDLTDKLTRRKEVEQIILQHVLQTTKEGLEKLGEKVDEVKIEGERSLRQAKKGLDHIIKTRSMTKAASLKDLRDMKVDDEVVRMKHGEQPKKGKKHDRFTRARRMIRERRVGGPRRQRVGRSSEEGEEVVGEKGQQRSSTRTHGEVTRTKWRKVLDAVHHGAIQIALQ